MVTISLEWTTAKWLLQGLVTSLLSGVGFLFITMALEYVKKYCRDKKQKEKALILEKILRGEEMLDITNDKAVVLVPKGRSLGKGETLSRASLLFNNYKQSGGFLGFGRGYCANRSGEITEGLEDDLAKIRSGVMDFPAWSNLNLGAVKPPGREEPGMAKNVSFKTSKDSPTESSISSVTKVSAASRKAQKILKLPTDSKGPKLWSQQPSNGPERDSKSPSPTSKKICEDMYKRLISEYPFIAPFLKRDMIDEIGAQVAAEIGNIDDTVHSETSKSTQNSPKAGSSGHKTPRTTILRKRVARSDAKSRLINESPKCSDKQNEGTSVDGVKCSETSPKSTKSPLQSPKLSNQRKKWLTHTHSITKVIGKNPKPALAIQKKNMNSKSQPVVNNVDQNLAATKAKRSRSVSLGKNKSPGDNPVKGAVVREKTLSKEKLGKSQDQMSSPSQSNIKEFGSSVDNEPAVCVEKPTTPKAKVDVGFIVDSYPTNGQQDNPKQNSISVGGNCEKVALPLAFDEGGKEVVHAGAAVGTTANSQPEDKKPRSVSFIRPVLGKSLRKLRKKSFIREPKPRPPKKPLNTLPEVGVVEVRPAAPPPVSVEPKIVAKKRILQRKPKPLDHEQKTLRSPVKQEKTRGRSPQRAKKPSRQLLSVRRSLQIELRSGSMKSQNYFSGSRATVMREDSASGTVKYAEVEKHKGKKNDVEKYIVKRGELEKHILKRGDMEKHNVKRVEMEKHIGKKGDLEKHMSNRGEKEKRTGKKRVSTPSPDKRHSKGTKRHDRSLKTTVRSPETKAYKERFVKKKTERKDRTRDSRYDDSPPSYLSSSESEESPPVKHKHAGKRSKDRRDRFERSESEKTSPSYFSPPETNSLKRKQSWKKKMASRYRDYSPQLTPRKGHNSGKSKAALPVSHKLRRTHVRSPRDRVSINSQPAQSTEYLSGRLTPSNHNKLRESTTFMVNNTTENDSGDDDVEDDPDSSGLEENLKMPEGMKTISDYKVRVSQRRLLDTIGPIVTYHPKKKRKNADMKEEMTKNERANEDKRDLSPGKRDAVASSPDFSRLVRAAEIDANISGPSVFTMKDNLYRGSGDTEQADADQHGKECITQSSDEICIKFLPAVDSEKAAVKCKENKKAPQQEVQQPSEKTMEISTGSMQTSDSCCGCYANPSGESKSSSRAATYSYTGSMYTASSRRSTPLEDITECPTESIKSSSCSDTCDLAGLSKCDLQSRVQSPTPGPTPQVRKNPPRSNISPRPVTKPNTTSPPIMRNINGDGTTENPEKSKAIVLKKSALDDMVQSMQKSPVLRITPSPSMTRVNENVGYLDTRHPTTATSSFPPGSINIGEGEARPPNRTRIVGPSRRPYQRVKQVPQALSLQVKNSVAAHLPPAAALGKDCGDDRGQVVPRQSAFSLHGSRGFPQDRLGRERSRPSSVASLRNEDTFSTLGRDTPSTDAVSQSKALFGSGHSFQVETFASANEKSKQELGGDSKEDPWKCEFQGKPFEEYRTACELRDED